MLPIFSGPAKTPTRTGRQPHNRIGTLHECLARAQRPRLTVRERHRLRMRRLMRREVRRVLAAELPAALAYYLTTKTGGNGYAPQAPKNSGRSYA
jgi:hypothetical protein